MWGFLGVCETQECVKPLPENKATKAPYRPFLHPSAPMGLSLPFVLGFFFTSNHCFWLNSSFMVSRPWPQIPCSDFSFYSSSSFCRHFVPASAIFLAPPCLPSTWSTSKWDNETQASCPNYFVYICICMSSSPALSLIFLSFLQQPLGDGIIFWCVFSVWIALTNSIHILKN